MALRAACSGILKTRLHTLIENHYCVISLLHTTPITGFPPTDTVFTNHRYDSNDPMWRGLVELWQDHRPPAGLEPC